MSDVTNYDGCLEAMADYCESMYLNLAKAESAYHDTEENAYVKSLPSKYLDFVGIKKLGGRTVVMNQLLKNGSTETVNDVTFTNNGDGSWTINGTANDDGYKRLDNLFTQTFSGHKYYIHGDLEDGSDSTYYISINGIGAKCYNKSVIGNGYDGPYGSTAFTFKSGQTFDNLKIYVWYTDLTLMFGSGNEPATTAEVEAILSADYYAYNLGSLLSAGITGIISKDSNDTTLQTFDIPSEITTMEGYGWSCPDAYNYIDFENKKFVFAVGTRAYEAGDESDSTVITDKTNTYYELDEPLEFDVSEYLTDTDLNVEAGGSITFESQLGDDYQIPVPVELEYIGVS